MSIIWYDHCTIHTLLRSILTWGWDVFSGVLSGVAGSSEATGLNAGITLIWLSFFYKIASKEILITHADAYPFSLLVTFRRKYLVFDGTERFLLDCHILKKFTMETFLLDCHNFFYFTNEKESKFTYKTPIAAVFSIRNKLTFTSFL